MVYSLIHSPNNYFLKSNMDRADERERERERIGEEREREREEREREREREKRRRRERQVNEWVRRRYSLKMF